LEREYLTFVSEGEDHAVRHGDRVGFRGHDELERGVLAATRLFVEPDGGRERGASRVGVAEEDLNEALLVEVAVTVCKRGGRELSCKASTSPSQAKDERTDTEGNDRRRKRKGGDEVRFKVHRFHVRRRHRARCGTVNVR
jgi:hypothetical protein